MRLFMASLRRKIETESFKGMAANIMIDAFFLGIGLLIAALFLCGGYE